MSEQLRLDKPRYRHGVRRVKPHLLGKIVSRAGRQYRRHQPLLTARFFEAVQHVRKEWADCEVIVLAMQQEGDAPDAGAELGGVVAKLPRRFHHALPRCFRQARLVFQRSRYRADRHTGCARDITNSCGHRVSRLRIAWIIVYRR